MSGENLKNFHSAIRWGKPIADIEGMWEKDNAVVNGNDERNGNQALHLSAQNGHLEITKWLIEKGGNINGVNGKGQTPLHMSVAYDFYAQTKFLLENGADKDLENMDGNKAIFGIDGDHHGALAWDSPGVQLAACSDDASMRAAFAAIEDAIKNAPDTLDKSSLILTGSTKKKMLKDVWDHAAFIAIAKEVP